MLVATGGVYLRGWRRLSRDLPERLPPWRAASFVAGLGTFFVAVASPLDAFASLLLQVHMLQHFLLMMVAPPLLWLGLPELPLLHGLPSSLRRDGLGPFLRWPVLHRVRSFLTHPVVCFVCFVGVTWLWHVPALYETALVDPFWHEVEHAAFFGSALLFWFPVIQPWPSVARWSRWAMVPYLFLASLQATAFSALFVFNDRVLYPIYAAAPRLGGISALDDQRVAGAVMWVPGAFVLLGATMVLVASLLSPRLVRPGAAQDDGFTRPAEREPESGFWDRAGVRALLRSRGFRRGAQLLSLVVAAIVIVDGFRGSRMGAMNLAGVVPWTWVRTFVVFGLLAVANVFCFACPFLLPRELARRALPASRAWPRALRSKWLAVALFVAYLWAYEVFALWDSPAWTAWLLVAYFVTAFVVDGLFRGASFCKYVCPIGQFNFVGSLVSPLEVGVRSAEACDRCTTRDCIRGREGARGCELDLFLPTKVGNLDCTFCMDCVRACPHDNVALVPRAPGAELLHDPPRASFGRFGMRRDIAALALVVVLGAFVNAAGMVEPVARAMRDLAASIGTSSAAVFSAFVVVSLIVVPSVAAWRSEARGSRERFCRLALALVPLGMGMWAAHLLLHFVHGAGAVIPVVASSLRDVGLSSAVPDWSLAHVMGPSSDGLVSLQILLLDLGLLATLYLGWRVSRPSVPSVARTIGVIGPWATFVTLLFCAGVWILFQPMEMRGMLMTG